MKITGYGKKILSLVLAAAMTASLCTPVWAEETDSAGLQAGGENIATVETAQPDNVQQPDSEDAAQNVLNSAQPATLSLDQPDVQANGTTVTVSDEEQWKSAITNAEAGVETTIMVEKDLVLSASMTVGQDQILVVDFQGHSVTVAPTFSGRIFINNGTLTLQGNGIVDVSAAGANGYGTVNNFGTLTVVDGTYTNLTESDASNFYNRKGGAATFENPTINGGGGCVATEVNTTTTINGGVYNNKTYPAIENRGNMLITAGTFTNTSCSSCDGRYGYTVRSGERSETAYLKIQGENEDSVQVTGVQGGLAVIGGTADIYNGIYRTEPCAVHSNGASAFYAGYFTGESYKTATNIYGGTFESCTKTGILVGNGNPAPDSGAGEESTVMIYGGSFTGGDAAKTAISVNREEYAVGAAYVEGGNFSSDPSAYVADKNCSVEEQDGRYVVQKLTAENAVAQIGDVYYTSLAAAIEKVGQGETITLLRDVPDAEGVSVASGKNFTVDFAGHTYTVSRPGAGSATTETNAFQLLKDSTITFKNGTLRISEKNLQAGAGKPIMRMIQNYADLTLDNMQIYAANQAGGEDYVLSFNNGHITFKGNTSIYMTNPAGSIAFDVCYWQGGGYTGTWVTFDEEYTGTIQGKIVYDSTDAAKAALTVQGSGSFQGIETSENTVNGADVSVYSGYFVNDPTAYLADKKAAVASDKDGYNYMVVDKTEEAAEVVPGAPAVENPASSAPDASKEEIAMAEELGKNLSTLSVTQDVVTAAAHSVANENQITAEESEEALTNENVSVDGKQVTIVIQPYLDIQLEETSVQNQEKSFKLDITPMYRTIATTADVQNNETIVVKDETEEGKAANAVLMGKPKKLTITKEVQMSIQLPADFAAENETLFIYHWKMANLSYCYEGKVDGKNVLTFTNPNGFSEFTVTNDTRKAVISLDGQEYTLTGNLLNSSLPTASKDGFTFQGLKFDQVPGGPYKVLTEDLFATLSALYSSNQKAIVATAVFTENQTGGNETSGESNSSSSTSNSNTPQQSGGNITYYTCPACGYHDWTATTEGYKCNHCGYLESVKQLSGYGNVKGVYEPKTSAAAAASAGNSVAASAIPQTSDDLPLTALIVVAIAALVGLGIVVVMKKRNKH